MSFFGPGGWGPGGGGYQPGNGGGRPGFGGGGGGPGGPGGNTPGNIQPLPNSQDPNSQFYGTPFPPTLWPLGRFPTIGTDVPIMATFVVIFFLAALLHLAGTFINAARGHKVLTSALLFLFCLVRVAALSTRSAGAYMGYNGDLYISGFVLTFGGTPLLYLVNLIFAHRVIRLQHPIIGRWNPILYVFFIFIYLLLIIAWAILIAGLVQPFYWRDAKVLRFDRNFRIYSFTFFAIIAVLPIPLVLISSIIPRLRRHRRYGHVSMAFKIIILLLATTLTAGEAVFLAVTAWKHEIPRDQPPPSWTSRTFYYIFIFVLEILVVYLYVIARVDQRITGARYDDRHDRNDPRDSNDTPRNSRERDRSISPEFANGAGEKAPKKRLFGLLPAKTPEYREYPTTGSPRRSRMAPRDEGYPEKKSRFGGFGKFALGAAGGAAAGAATAGAIKHHKNKRDGERSRSRERSDRAKSVAWQDELEKEEAINRDLGYTNLGGHHENHTFNVPRKELRPFDTETIPEESEEDSDGSLYAPGSSLRTDSKPMSPASTVAEPDRERLRPKSAMKDFGQREPSRSRDRSRRLSL